MNISIADALSTLAVLLPGFIALKVFYVAGIRTRRSDAEWFAWSLLAAAPIAGAAALLRDAVVGWGWRWATDGPDLLFLGFALTLGLAAGVLLVALWGPVIRRWPRLATGARLQAWDTALASGGWVTVFTQSGHAVFGALGEIADSAQTDDLDLYLTCPAWYDTEADRLLSMEPVEGVLIARSEMTLIQKFAGTGEKSVWDQEIGALARARYSAPADDGTTAPANT